MKKKIGLIMSIVVLFVFVFSGVKNAYVANAEESNDFVIGTENLNNTSENSAKVGDQLKLPEKGWKRYDDSNPNISYIGDYVSNRKGITTDDEYNKTRSCIYNKAGQKIKFNFTGSKLRILSFVDEEQYAHSTIIKIDNEQENYSYNLPYSIAPKEHRASRLVYEKLDLSEGEHTVEIIELDDKAVGVDAIDVEESSSILIPRDLVKAESITLDKTSMDLLEGSSDKITSTVLPDDATNKKVIWSSSDESIAKVDENGNVTAIKEGQATITAKVENTDLTATCKVNVTKPVEENKNNAILSISLVNGATKEYDVSMEEVDKFINWFEERSSGNGPSLYSFDKKISPYKSVKEYIVHDKIASFEVREYEATK